MITLEVKGLKELQAKLEKLPVEFQNEVRGVLEDGAKQYVRLAKRDAPVDFGFLRNGISYAFVLADKTRCTFEIVSNARYSPYLEWGTITRVSVPPGEEPYAVQFKGRGIKKTGGIYPHPFFFKQKPIVKKLIEQDIKTILEDIKI